MASTRILNSGYSLVTLFLYMVAELSALQQIINALTGLDGLPVVIVECAVTTIYTCEWAIGIIPPLIRSRALYISKLWLLLLHFRSSPLQSASCVPSV